MIRLIRTIDSLSYAGGLLAAVCNALFCLLIVVNVVSRLLFNSPLTNADEMSVYLLLGVACLGFAYALREKAHIMVSIVPERLSPRSRSVLYLAVSIVALGWAVPFLAGSIELWMNYFSGGVRGYGALGMRIWIPALGLVIGTSLLLLATIAEVLKSILLLRRT